MLHCFQCGADLPDNLVFCLHCGAKLEDDETETVVIPEPVTPPPIDIAPKPRGGAAKFVLGSLLGAVLVILLLAVGAVMWVSLRPEPPLTTANVPVNKSSAESPSPQPSSSPSPRKPSPSPTPSAVNDNTEPGTTAKTCTITNPAGGSVNIRRNCDTRDCAMDPATLYTQADPGDTVEATSRKPVTTGRFTWVPVKYHGEVVWISSTRIDCD